MDDLEPLIRQPLRVRDDRGSPQFEFRMLTLPRGTSRGAARQLLTEHAEYGRWELARVRLSMGGVRTVWLRRRILRVDRTA